MSDVPSSPVDESLEHLSSSYQWMTAGRLLGRSGVQLDERDVLVLLKYPNSFYYQLLLVPMMNLLNGIILDQTKEYQLFLQKLFVDFLMSGEADVTQDQGMVGRHALEEERTKMIARNQVFAKLLQAHQGMIAACQAALVKLTADWEAALKEASRLLSQSVSTAGGSVQMTMGQAHQLFLTSEGLQVTAVGWDQLEKQLGCKLTPENRAPFEALSRFSEPLKSFLDDYEPQVRAQTQICNEERTTYYADILRIQELLYNLPLFKFDELVDQKNRDRLKFDHTLGKPD